LCDRDSSTGKGENKNKQLKMINQLFYLPEFFDELEFLIFKIFKSLFFGGRNATP
jgi:hypothetical protein